MIQQKGAKPVTYKTIGKWAGEKCNKWRVRKEAKRQAEKQDILDTLHELDKADKIEEFKKKKRFKQKLLDRLLIEAETAALSQLRQGADAYIAMGDDNRVDKEEPTTFTNQKLDVDAETKVQYEGVENLLEVFHASKNEWNKHNSE